MVVCLSGLILVLAEMAVVVGLWSELGMGSRMEMEMEMEMEMVLELELELGLELGCIV